MSKKEMFFNCIYVFVQFFCSLMKFVCCKLCDLIEYKYMVTGYLQSLTIVPNYNNMLHLVSEQIIKLAKLQLLNFCPFLCVSVFVITVKILIRAAE